MAHFCCVQIVFLAPVVSNSHISNGAFDHLGNYYCFAKTPDSNNAFRINKLDKDTLQVPNPTILQPRF